MASLWILKSLRTLRFNACNTETNFVSSARATIDKISTKNIPTYLHLPWSSARLFLMVTLHSPIFLTESKVEKKQEAILVTAKSIFQNVGIWGLG